MKWFVNRDSPNLYIMPGSKSMAQLSWENKGPVSLDSLAISTLHCRVPELALRSNDLYDINRAAQHVSSTRSGLPSWGTSVWNTPKGYASTTLNVTDGYQSLSQPCKPERLGDKTDSKPMTFFFAPYDFKCWISAKWKGVKYVHLYYSSFFFLVSSLQWSPKHRRQWCRPSGRREQYKLAMGWLCRQEVEIWVKIQIGTRRFMFLHIYKDS